MTEQQSLADKVLSELPEGLAAATRFEGDEKGNLLMFFSFKLASTDFPLVLEVVKRYNGDFANKKDSATGKDVGYFYIPKPKTAETKKEEPKLAAETPAKAEQPATSPAPQEQPKEQEKAPSDAKPEQAVKQPSPITQFASSFCSVCADSGSRCNSATSSGRDVMALCLKTMRVQVLQLINVNLEKINAKMSLRAVEKPVVQPSPVQQSLPQHQSEKVERSTRPTEGFEEDGLVWVKMFESGTSNIKFLKAYDKDNKDRQRFKDLSDWIASKGDKPFAKQLFLGVECEVFLWNFNQGPKAIGKSKCKSGGRR